MAEEPPHWTLRVHELLTQMHLYWGRDRSEISLQVVSGLRGPDRRRASFMMNLSLSQTLVQVMWAISSAISVACFALSGIAAQLLSALGLDGE